MWSSGVRAARLHKQFGNGSGILLSYGFSLLNSAIIILLVMPDFQLTMVKAGRMHMLSITDYLSITNSISELLINIHETIKTNLDLIPICRKRIADFIFYSLKHHVTPKIFIEWNNIILARYIIYFFEKSICQIPGTICWYLRGRLPLVYTPL